MAVQTRRAVVTAVAALLVGLGICAPAAADQTWGINGTWAYSVNGDWAKINSRYEDQPSERGTFTISTDCTSPTDCSGTVTSDQGWNAPIYTTNGIWYIKRSLENWRYCENGTPIGGQQVYMFYPISWDGRYMAGSDEYTGDQKTTGPSGSCGRNQWPTIEIPFYMKRV